MTRSVALPHGAGWSPAGEWRLPVAAVLTGVTAGAAAMALALVLHAVQHLAYGFDLHTQTAPETFLQGVTAATPLRRGAALLGAGLVAGVGWWALARFGAPKVSVGAAVGRDAVSGKRMLAVTTVLHALLQEITVGLGSPLGREVAPRELGTLAGQAIVARLGLSPDDVRIVVACGAGAGLAAIYNVPLAGALFTLEVLLCTATPRTVGLALVTSVLATVTAWTGLGDNPQYHLPSYRVNGAILLWSIVAGPLLGAAAFAFSRMVDRCEREASSGWRRIVMSLLVFIALGLVSGGFPTLPGNGKGPLQMLFDGNLALPLAAALLALKILAIAGALRAGVAGGVLTPSMTVGALMAVLLGGVWSLWMPGTPLGAYALVGAGAFMGSVLAMPLTALVLMTELGGTGAALIAPMVLASSGSLCVFHALTRFQARGASNHP